MSDENDIDIFELMDLLKHGVKQFTSLVKSIDQAKVEFDNLSHTREESVIAANQPIKGKHDIPGDYREQDHTTNKPTSNVVDLEPDSTGGYRVKPKQLPSKKSFKI